MFFRASLFKAELSYFDRCAHVVYLRVSAGRELIVYRSDYSVGLFFFFGKGGSSVLYSKICFAMCVVAFFLRGSHLGLLMRREL